MPKNTTSSFVQSISAQTGIPQSKVKAILSAFFDVTMNEVADNGRIVLRGFGSFFSKEKKGRTYRDLKTGEIKKSTSRSVPSFQPSKVLLREMNPGTPVSVRKKDSSTKEPTIQASFPKQKNVPRSAPKQDEPCEIIISKPNPRQTDDLRINYNPTTAFDSSDVYPVVYTPAKGSLLKLPREGRSDIRGYKEADFLNALSNEFSDISVSDNCHLSIPGRYSPYEPDFVLYDDKLNMYIDVEIDEPYDGYSRLVTHIIEGSDSVRDVFFKESGWVVVRFTEKQVHLHTAQCIQTLRNIIDSMRGKVRPCPPAVEEEKRWSRRQAIEWERDLYREKYLGIQFFSKQARTRKIQCRDNVEGIDLAIERTPIHFPEIVDTPAPKQETGTKKVTRDKGTVHPAQKSPEELRHDDVTPLYLAQPPALSFQEETHTYSTPGDESGNTDRMSVTTLIEQFFPHFDEESYIKKRMEETGMSEDAIRRELAEPSERGTDMHKQIENFLKGLPYDDSSREFQFFQRFYQEQIVRRGLVFDSAEYPIELKEANIAGTVDALFRKPDGEYVMVDWKRSKHLIIDGYAKKYGFGRGLSVLSHLDNSSYYKYELQQSFYKYILEKDYGIRVSSMILAVLYPEYDRYYVIKLSEYRRKEVMDMIESYENIQK